MMYVSALDFVSKAKVLKFYLFHYILYGNTWSFIYDSNIFSLEERPK